MFDVNNVSESLKTLRKELGLSQDEFGRMFRVPIHSIRNWEQGIRLPDMTSTTYLFVISQMPGEIAEKVKII